MFDGLVTISGCDKTIPAMAMVELKDVEDHACPGAGACGGQFTANTMATAYEMLGISAMGSIDIAAVHPLKADAARECGRLAVELVQKGITPRSLVTRYSFENAITGVMATGGSTNSVLHLLATASDFAIPLSIDDFDRLSRRTPVLADLRPWGTFTAPEMFAAGGMAVVGKRLLEAGLLHAQEKTVTGRSLGEEIGESAGTRRPECHQTPPSAAEKGGRHRHSTWQSCSGRLRDEDLGRDQAHSQRTGARFRARGGRIRIHQAR
jgi:dihydroxyacid dehydratase/phosphogluconate dehydratase